MQLEFFDVPSPCVSICQSDDKGCCLGCFRTREERSQWTSLTSDGKQKVVKRCLQRKKRKMGKVKEKVVEQPMLDLQPSLLDPKPVTVSNDHQDLDFGDFDL